MESIDRKLRHIAAQEDWMPQAAKDRIEQTLSDLPEQNITVFRPRRAPRILTAAASLLFALLFLMPNLSPAYARSMEKLPLIGELVKVVTIRNYLYEDGNYDLELQVPEVQNQIADPINQDVQELTKALLTRFYTELDLSGSQGHGSIRMEYETVTDSREWFTLKITVQQIEASSSTDFRYYHIDKGNGTIVSLGDLFADDRYQEVLQEEIRRQMQQLMSEDPDLIYWLEPSKAGKDFLTIEDSQNFYWADDGSLTIVFDKYAVGPGSSGTPEFRISPEVYGPLLKPEYQK